MSAYPNQPPPSPAEYLRPYPTTENYAAFLADYCRLANQVADLVPVVMLLWEHMNELRRQLDLPRIPLPIAGSLACAMRSASVTSCTPIQPLAIPAGADDVCAQTSGGHDGFYSANADRR